MYYEPSRDWLWCLKMDLAASGSHREGSVIIYSQVDIYVFIEIFLN